MTDLDVDWVEIPAGESLAGISEEQKEIVRKHVHVQYGVDQLDRHTQALIEEIREIYRVEAATMTKQERLEQTLKGRRLPFSSEQEEVKRQFRYIFRVDGMLREMGQKRVKLGTFYIARFPITEEQLAKHLGWRQPEHPGLPAPASWYRADRFSHEVGGAAANGDGVGEGSPGTRGVALPVGERVGSGARQLRAEP